MTVRVPATVAALFEVQDQSGQHSTIRVNYGYSPDITVDTTNYWSVFTLQQIVGTIINPNNANDVARNFQALTNAKVVRVGFLVDTDWAGEPMAESGTYKYVQTKASTSWMDGQGGKERMAIPAPVDTLFLTGVGMQTVVDPAGFTGGTGHLLYNFQHELAGAGALTPTGGIWGSQFFGGQLVQGKPPRRRRIQSQ